MTLILQIIGLAPVSQPTSYLSLLIIPPIEPDLAIAKLLAGVLLICTADIAFGHLSRAAWWQKVLRWLAPVVVGVVGFVLVAQAFGYFANEFGWIGVLP